MTQSTRKNISKTLATAAMGGMLLGSAALMTGCHNDKDKDNAGMSTESTTGAQHACKGQNACKGQGSCKTSEHACKGQNACKGQGGCKST
jgi:hypothetical protein